MLTFTTLRQAYQEAIKQGKIWVVSAGTIRLVAPDCEEDRSMLETQRQLQGLGLEWVWC